MFAIPKLILNYSLKMRIGIKDCYKIKNTLDEKIVRGLGGGILSIHLSLVC